MWTDSAGKIVSQTASLDTSGFNKSSGGDYSCRVDWSDGDDWDVLLYKIQVLYKPTVTVEQDKVGLENGTSQDLTCSVEANPEAKIKWLKDGVDIPNATEKTYKVEKV